MCAGLGPGAPNCTRRLRLGTRTRLRGSLCFSTGGTRAALSLGGVCGHVRRLRDGGSAVYADDGAAGGGIALAMTTDGADVAPAAARGRRTPG